MGQVLLTEQTILPIVNFNSVISVQSNYANYHSISSTNGSNSLIDILENVIVLVGSADDETA